MPSLIFNGLCVVGHIKKECRAFLPMRMGHRPVLMIQGSECNADASAPMRPDFIAHDKSGVQYLGWDLSGRTLKFENGTGAPTWREGERDRTIQLGQCYPKCRIKAVDGIPVVHLPSGSLSCERRSEVYKVKGDPRNATYLQQIASAILWEGSAHVLTWTGNRVVMFPYAQALISNVASNRGGMAHFDAYYDFFDPIPKDKVTIHPPIDPHHTVDVFDCVPPIPLP